LVDFLLGKKAYANSNFAPRAKGDNMSYEVKIVHELKDNELLIMHNGKLINSYCDYGEPEDNSFLRDYDWIKSELEKAYLLGKQDVLKSIIETKVGWGLTFGLFLLKITGIVVVTWLQVIAPAIIVTAIWFAIRFRAGQTYDGTKKIKLYSSMDLEHPTTNRKVESSNLSRATN
jgi:hypothetical protein